MLTVLSVTAAREKILKGTLSVTGAEILPLSAADGRFLARPVTASTDLPPFARSTMDGYAVAAADTFGASEAQPALLTVVGEVSMGQAPVVPLQGGEAMPIATGGMLPVGSDAVVMVEYTEVLGADTVAVHRAVAPGENTIARGEDFKAGEVVLPAGHRLRPQDIGVLAAMGVTEVAVAARPRVAVISTGDELVPPELEPGPGQVRDVNSCLLAALATRTGAVAEPLGIVRDRYDDLVAVLGKARGYDCVILSGGSSAGARDHTAAAINAMGKPGVLFHGVSMRPGKPLIYGLVDGCPYFGLSGNPTSAMVGFLLFVRPLLLKLQGGSEEQPLLWARTDRNLSSAGGREDYVRAVLYNKDGELWATPLLGQAGLLATVVRGDALLRLPQNSEGAERGEKLEVILI